jgi:hypothetical protein
VIFRTWPRTLAQPFRTGLEPGMHVMVFAHPSSGQLEIVSTFAKLLAAHMVSTIFGAIFVSSPRGSARSAVQLL